MSIIPCGKSDLFQSELEKFKDEFVSQYTKEALEEIPYLEVESEEDSEIRCV